MSSFFNNILGATRGLKPETIDVEAYLVNTAQVTTTYTRGQIGMLDRLRQSTDTTNSRPGATGSRWLNVRTPIVTGATSGISVGTFLVALESIPKGTLGKWRLKGYVQASVVNGAEDAIAGDLCSALTSSVSLQSSPTLIVAGSKLIFELDAPSTAATATLIFGWFDGE